MGVFQPTAIVGNERVVVTLGNSAELMAFFYPRCDHAQNVREGLTGIYLDGYGFSWLFTSEWRNEQRYLDGEATVLTELTSPALGLGISVCDFVLPDRPVLLRQWQVRSLDGKPKRLKLMHYFELTLDGYEFQQAVQVVNLPHPTPRPAVVQWQRRNWCGVSSDLPFQLWQCGKGLPNAHNYPKLAMMSGWLSGQVLEIGKVAFAVGWQLSISAFGSVERTMAIAFGEGKRDVLRQLSRTLSEPFESHRKRQKSEWQSWLNRIDGQVKTMLKKSLVKRSVLEAALWNLRLLWDKSVDAPIAAPEFDPNFEASGGYGFCWCRDAAFMAHAFAELGMVQKAARFFDWCVKVQSPDGFFHQRYWLDGCLAPAWSEDHDCLQLDQTASVVWSAGKVFQRKNIIPSARVWAMLTKALAFLESRLTAGLHQTGMDLWETFRGSFTYTQASLIAAFQSGAQLASALGERQQANHWQTSAEQAKEALLKKLWTGKGFLRGLTPDGHPDATTDASILSVVFPFGVLDLNDVKERQIAEATVQQVLTHLTKKMADGGIAVWRFVGDSYAWGMASTPATLWLGLAAMELANVQCSMSNRWWRDIAFRCLQTCAMHTTPVGLQAEMFEPFGKGYWAAGHGWSAAWLLLLALKV